jgi:hypothetical protein
MKRFALVASAALTLLMQSVSLAQSTPVGRGAVWSDGTGAPITYQFNTSGGTNTITKTATGRYTVRFPGLGTSGGNVQVTAYRGNHHCKVVNWYSSGTDQIVNVACFSPNGAAIDGLFTAMFENYPAPNSSLYQSYKKAYVWADQPNTASYNPSAGYQYNSANSINSIQRIGTGTYDVQLGRMNELGGNVQVTAYGDNSDHCKVQHWNTASGVTTARVRCFNTFGQAADSRFSLNYQMRNTLMGNEYSDFYSWNAGAPSPTYEHNGGFGGAQSLANPSVGNYTVTLPAKMSGYKTSALITGYGASSDRCNINYWNTASSATTSQVHVSCVNAQGQPVNSAFSLRFLSNAVVPW